MNTKNLGILALVFVAGFLGIGLGQNAFTSSEQPTMTPESGTILGHVEIIHTDANGNVVSYEQSDNAVMNQGKNCAAKVLFGGSALSSQSTCTLNAGRSFWNVIGLSNNALSSNPTTQTTLPGEFFLSSGTCAGICRNSANSTATVSASSDATTDGGSKTVRISKTFTLTNASATIRSAGLFNSTDTSNYSTFALKPFSSAVSMAQNDQLTVNWDITLG